MATRNGRPERGCISGFGKLAASEKRQQMRERFDERRPGWVKLELLPA